MSLEPLIHAPLVVQAHVATVIPAFLLGAWLIVFSRKGSHCHRALGALGMSLTHLFVPFVLCATWRALSGALKGNIKQHQRWVMGLFFGALVINGSNNVLFPARNHTRRVFWPVTKISGSGLEQPDRAHSPPDFRR
jgi:uncharacterized membrane protein